MNISFRKGDLSDLDLLVDMETRCFNPPDAFSRRTIRRMLHNSNNSVVLDVIEVDQATVGYAVFFTRQNSRKIRLYSLCLLPQYSGRGIAKCYLHMRMKSLAQEFIEVILEVRASNKRAQALYTSLGFKIQRITNNYYSDGEDAFNMSCLLNGTY